MGPFVQDAFKFSIEGKGYLREQKQSSVKALSRAAPEGELRDSEEMHSNRKHDLWIHTR